MVQPAAGRRGSRIAIVLSSCSAYLCPCRDRHALQYPRFRGLPPDRLSRSTSLHLLGRNYRAQNSAADRQLLVLHITLCRCTSSSWRAPSASTISRASSSRTRKVLLANGGSPRVSSGQPGCAPGLQVFKLLNENIGALFTLAGFDLDVRTWVCCCPSGFSPHVPVAGLHHRGVSRHPESRTPPGMFALYVMFFPQLVAAAIERPAQPARADRTSAHFPLRQGGGWPAPDSVWGLFKKMVIADNCAIEGEVSGLSMRMDILLVRHCYWARSTSPCRSMVTSAATATSPSVARAPLRLQPHAQLRLPVLLARHRRVLATHISLSSWFRDYVYVPLGGSRGGRWHAVRNTFIIFLLSGFWHGANWTFVCWGAINALYFLPLLLAGRRLHGRGCEGRLLPSFVDVSCRPFPDRLCGLGLLPREER